MNTVELPWDLSSKPAQRLFRTNQPSLRSKSSKKANSRQQIENICYREFPFLEELLRNEG